MGHKKGLFMLFIGIFILLFTPASISAQEEEGGTDDDESEEFEIVVPAMGIYKSEEPFYQIETLDYSQVAELEEEMAEEEEEGGFFSTLGDIASTPFTFVPNLFSDTVDDVQNNIKDSILYTLNGVVGILMTIIQLEAELVLAFYNFAFDSELMTFLLNQVEGTVQSVAGIDSEGNIMEDSGIFGNLFGLTIAISLFFVAIIFIVKKATIEALKALLSPVIVITIAMFLIANMTSILTSTNEITTTVMDEVTEIGTNSVFDESETTEVETTEDILHHTMVYKPYMLMQYGTYDEDTVDPERSYELLMTTNTSDRQAIIENELTEHGNAMVSPSAIWVKVAYGVFTLMVNLIISIPIIIIAGAFLMLEFIILFIVFLSPFALLWASLPNQFPVLKRYLGMLFSPFLYKLLISVFVMIMTTIFAIVYSMSSSYGIIGYGVSGFIMLVVMISMYLLKNKIMSIFTVTPEGQQMAKMANSGDGAVQSATQGVKSTAKTGAGLAMAYATGGTSALATRAAAQTISSNDNEDEANSQNNRGLAKLDDGKNDTSSSSAASGTTNTNRNLSDLNNRPDDNPHDDGNGGGGNGGGGDDDDDNGGNGNNGNNGNGNDNEGFDGREGARDSDDSVRNYSELNNLNENGNESNNQNESDNQDGESSGIENREEQGFEGREGTRDSDDSVRNYSELNNLKDNEGNNQNESDNQDREESDIEKRESSDIDDRNDASETENSGNYSELNSLEQKNEEDNSETVNRKNENPSSERSRNIENRESYNDNESVNNSNVKEPSSSNLESIQDDNYSIGKQEDKSVNNSNVKEPSSNNLESIEDNNSHQSSNNNPAASKVDTSNRERNDIHDNNNYQSKPQNNDYEPTKPNTKSEDLNDRDEASSRKGEDE